MTDERGVTTPLSYVLLVGIVALLAAGLFASTSGVVDNQQDRAVHSGLTSTGNRLAADLASTARLAETGNVTVDVHLPDRVAGVPYLVEVGTPTGSRYPITLSTTHPDVSVTVYVKSQTPIATGDRFAGGDLRLTYHTGDTVVISSV